MSSIDFSDEHREGFLHDCLEPVAAGQRASSPFSKLIATEVFDGPIAGLAICRRGGTSYFFRMVAWDHERRTRIYLVSRLDESGAAAKASALIRLLPDMEGEHWLAVPQDAGLAMKIRADIASLEGMISHYDYLLVSRDMLSGVEHAVRINDKNRSEVEDLAKRSPADAEVTDASFEEWMLFVSALQ
jgi:hypothetical protein